MQKVFLEETIKHYRECRRSFETGRKRFAVIRGSGLHRRACSYSWICGHHKIWTRIPKGRLWDFDRLILRFCSCVCSGMRVWVCVYMCVCACTHVCSLIYLYKCVYIHGETHLRHSSSAVHQPQFLKLGLTVWNLSIHLGWLVRGPRDLPEH